MAHVKQSIQMNVSATKAFDLIADFAGYTNVQPEMVKAEVLKKSRAGAVVAFTMNLLAEVNYTLKFTLKKPASIEWSLVEADSIIKENSGKWTFKKVSAKKTDVNYEMNVEFGGWIPSSIIEDLMQSHLPKMLENFKVAAEA